MKYLENEKLETITSFLTIREVGDRILNGRIEAFSCKRAGKDKKLSKILQQQYATELASSPSSMGTSPLGPLSESSTRRLLIDLISTMNASFPDHDFSALRPEQFLKERSIQVVINAVNKQLAPLQEAYNSTFLEEMWIAIEQAVELKDCEIYSYIPDMEEDPFSEGNLWTFNFFFFNKGLKRILYFTCIATSYYSSSAPYIPAESETESIGEMDEENVMGELEDDL